MEFINAEVQQQTINGIEVMTIIMHYDDQMNSPKTDYLKRLNSLQYVIEGDHILIHEVDSKILNIASIASIKEQVKDMKLGMVNEV